VDLEATYSSTKVIQTQAIDDGSNRRENVKIGQLDYASFACNLPQLLSSHFLRNNSEIPLS
jgi:hypothetical protein